MRVAVLWLCAALALMGAGVVAAFSDGDVPYRDESVREPFDAGAAVELGSQDEGMMYSLHPEIPMERARAMGATRYRLMADWGAITSAEGVYNWAFVDTAINTAVAYGLRPQVVIGHAVTPTFAGGSGVYGTGNGFPDVAKFRRFVSDLVSRNDNARKVAIWSIWNEPDVQGVDPCRWVELQRAGAEEIRARSPGSLILVGELSVRAKAFLDEVQRRCPTEIEADGFAIHPYETLREPGDGELYDLRNLRALRDRLELWRHWLHTPAGGRLPIYVTEYGYHRLESGIAGYRRYTDAEIARRICADHRAMRGLVEETVYYHMTPTTNPDDKWDTSLLDRSYRPRPVYSTIRDEVSRGRCG